MANNSLQQYLGLRRQLEQEREAIKGRLGQIEAVLGGEKGGPGRPPAAPSRPVVQKTSARPVAPAKVAARPQSAVAKGKAVANKLTMRSAIEKVLAKKPLAIAEVVQGMRGLGYVFKSSNPTNSVGAFLYGPEGKKNFVRKDGKFSVKK